MNKVQERRNRKAESKFTKLGSTSGNGEEMMAE